MIICLRCESPFYLNKGEMLSLTKIYKYLYLYKKKCFYSKFYMYLLKNKNKH